MSTLLSVIKADQLIARKARDSIRSALLTTLIGEASTIGKNAGNRESTDAEVQAVIQKFVKNLNETIEHLRKCKTWTIDDPSVAAIDKAMAERNYLTAYLPQQLTISQLEEVVRALFEDGANSIGAVMKALKEQYNGQYDGKLAKAAVDALFKRTK